MSGSGDAPFARCIAFEKYDGTNLHWVWDRELGWYAFGTRRDRFDLDASGIAAFATAHAGLEHAAQLFLDSLSNALTEVLHELNYYHSNEIIAFTEFLGPNSFAGKHRETDEKHLVLFDIQTDSGFLPPETFVDDFESLPIARVVYRGKLTGRFTHEVREGKYDVTEGVVCKGHSDGQVWMVKIKTDAYMETLKHAFADDWENYWE